VVQSVDFRPDGSGWGATASDPVPDRDRISPPVLDPAQNAPVNPTNITVRLQAGFALGDVKSHHHAVNTESPIARHGSSGLPKARCRQTAISS